MQQLANTLKDAEPGRLVANLSGLSQIAKLTPNVFEAHSETVATFIVQKLLMRSSEGEQDVRHENVLFVKFGSTSLTLTFWC